MRLVYGVVVAFVQKMRIECGEQIVEGIGNSFLKINPLSCAAANLQRQRDPSGAILIGCEGIVLTGGPLSSPSRQANESLHAFLIKGDGWRHWRGI